MRADKVHHIHVSHLGNERIVRGARRQVRADRTGQDGSRRRRRLNTGAKHHGDERGTDRSRATGSRRKRDVHEERDDRANRNQENA